MRDIPNHLKDFIPQFDVTINYQEDDLCYYDGILSIYTKDRRTGKLVWMNKDNCHQYDMFIESLL